ncbi:60S acidic ribosomal protein P2 [Leucoagaricus sp. SymC.cos]|nr:60S acidic ribosomal protein P2 [Leucoagaricus sp. SymC.cos]
MRYIAAVLLLIIGGTPNPDAAAVNKVLDAAGIECDNDRLDSLLSELEGKDINELIAEGNSKLASVPSGGAVAAGGGGGAAAAGGAAPAEEKKEEKEEEKEESDDDMGFDNNMLLCEKLSLVLAGKEMMGNIEDGLGQKGKVKGTRAIRARQSSDYRR